MKKKEKEVDGTIVSYKKSDEEEVDYTEFDTIAEEETLTKEEIREIRNKKIKESLEIDKCIGRKIRERRKELGMPQAELGKRMKDNLSSQQIQKYERGINRISSRSG